MYGFIGSFLLNGSLGEPELFCEPHGQENDLIFGEMTSGPFGIRRLTRDKFLNDKVFYESEELIVAIEGVIYNYSSLEKEYGLTDRGALLEKMFRSLSVKDFAYKLNGSFAGVVFDRKSNKLFLITDHISYKTVWYSLREGRLFFSTDIHWLYKTLSSCGGLDIEKDGIYCLLNYGYMLGDVTPVKGIKKLLAGNVLVAQNGALDTVNYYKITEQQGTGANVTPEEYAGILKKIDAALEKSVDAVYKKDDEYSYKHCMTLSGGMDSRTLLFMAHRLGYRTLCLTMGESGCTDIKIASRICHDLKEEHVVYELDNGIFMTDMDPVLEANGAVAIFPGAAHIRRLMSLVNFKEYGAVHSGVVGGLILGGTFLTDVKEVLSLASIMYGSTFLDRFSDEFKERELHRYSDAFHFNYYNRQLNSSGNGYHAASFYNEFSFPYIDKEFCDLAFSLPQALIKDHRLYFDYLKEYLPGACRYIWEHTGCRPGSGKPKRWLVKWKQRIKFRVFKKSISMNPFEKWYAENPDIKKSFDRIFESAGEIRNADPVLYADLRTRFDSPRVMDKSLACLAAAFIKKYGVRC